VLGCRFRFDLAVLSWMYMSWNCIAEVHLGGFDDLLPPEKVCSCTVVTVTFEVTVAWFSVLLNTPLGASVAHGVPGS
jgi:hypothetical protein